MARYVGLAADVKPTEDVPEGTEFFEYDTGATYTYGNGAWRLKPSSSVAGLPASLGQKTAAASLPVVVASDQPALSVVGASGGGVATLARPADTIPYAALDAIANSTSAPVILTFAGMARVNAGSGFITKAKLQTDQSTFVARVRLHLFNVANPTIPNDNAAFALKWADRVAYVGAIDFDACKTEGTGSDTAYSFNTTVRLHFTCAASDTSLYGLLETLDIFTPANAQNFRIALATDEY